MARFLIVLGLAILVVGLLWPYLGKLGLGRLPGDRGDQGHATRRHVHDLAGKLTPVGQHIAPEKVYFHALMPPAFLGQRQDHRFG